MAAKTTKSNKTDHVLNLLAGGGEDTDKLEGAKEHVEASSQMDKQDGVEVPVVQSVNDEQKIAESIREALEDEIEQEIELEEAVNVETKEEMEDTDDSEEEATQEPIEDVCETKVKEDFAFLNVMEHLVRDKVKGYMDQFGNCTCSRCVADTTALALTRLPAKYVVISKETVSPLLNFYESKYAGDITVEITKACIRVKEFPHHN